MTTIKLHNIKLEELERLANGYILARDSSGDLRLHNGSVYRGYVNKWGTDRFQVAWFDQGAGIFRYRRTFRTQRGAEAFLRRKAAEYRPIQAVA